MSKYFVSTHGKFRKPHPPLPMSQARPCLLLFCLRVVDWAQTAAQRLLFLWHNLSAELILNVPTAMRFTL